MAPLMKLKQSSLHSFLRPNPTTTTATAAEDDASTDPTPNHAPPSAALDYEQERKDNIRRNQDFLRNLGIVSTVPLPTAKPRPPKPTKPRSPPLPLRRSIRKRPPISDPETNEPSSPPLHRPPCADPSVVQYTCDRSSKDPIFASGRPVSGFRITGKTMRDPALTKIYAVDVCCVEKRRVLVAAGGHGGMVSVFGGEIGEVVCGGDSEMEVDGPLVSWKASKSWVSGVAFVEGNNPMLLLSSSNNGELVLWDTKVLMSSSFWSPPVVAELRGLHSGGIFSMDQLSCSVTTASKDSSVGVTRITSAGELVVERNISGHHKGVIRGVCFGGATFRLADCGADGCLCVLDTRLPGPCTLTIESNHSSGVNNVAWSPSNEFLLMSASKDPTLLLYDIRNSSEPVHSLQGPVDSGSYSFNQIYKPTFVDNGLAIATPDQGLRKISLYSIITGKLLSQGLLGYRVNLVSFITKDLDYPRLWTAGKQINQLCPLKVVQSCPFF